MKKTFKGFTLVECLVAMAILAIASTLMASIYAAVNKRNNFNHFNNSSLANQMAYIEKYEEVETVAIKHVSTSGVTAPPHNASDPNSGTTAYVKITNSITSEEYSYPVDIYIMYSRDTQNDASRTGTDDGAGGGSSANSNYSQMFTEQNNNLRYKYILGTTS